MEKNCKYAQVQRKFCLNLELQKTPPFFKSKMEIKGCVYVQEIIAAFLQTSI